MSARKAQSGATGAPAIMTLNELCQYMRRPHGPAVPPTRSEFEQECEGDPERLAKGIVTGRKGHPLLFTDGAR